MLGGPADQVSLIADIENVTLEECAEYFASSEELLPPLTSTLDKKALKKTSEKWSVILDASLGGQESQKRLRERLGESGYSKLWVERGTKGTEPDCSGKSWCCPSTSGVWSPCGCTAGGKQGTDRSIIV